MTSMAEEVKKDSDEGFRVTKITEEEFEPREIKNVFLYTDRCSSALDLEKMRQFVIDTMGKKVNVEIRGDFFKHNLKGEELEKAAGELHQAKKWMFQFPIGEWDKEKRGKVSIAYEEKVLQTENMADMQAKKEEFPSAGPFIYDTDSLLAVYQNHIKPEERSDVHIVFTGRDVASSENFPRIHSRVGSFGLNAAVLSTTMVCGLESATGKHRDVEEAYQRSIRGPIQSGAMVIPQVVRKEIEENIYKTFEDVLMRPDDPRMNDVLKVYVLRELLLASAADAVCRDKSCLLYDVPAEHYQTKDMEKAQNLASGEAKHFCEKHQDVLKKLKE